MQVVNPHRTLRTLGIGVKGVGVVVDGSAAIALESTDSNKHFPAGVGMALLEALQGFAAGKKFPLEGVSVTLGRHPACDIVLESVSVSRQHARILSIDGDFYVEDLHSRNGTLLNGRPVVQRQLLAENDELGICDLSFAFHRGPPSRGSPPPARAATRPPMR